MQDKKQLLRWCGWFFFGNSLLFWLIGARYFSAVAWLDTDFLTVHHKIFISVFLALSYVGQLSLLAFIPAVFIMLLIFLFPKRHFVFALAILLATLAAGILLIDTFTYRLYHYHLNGVIFALLLDATQRSVFELSSHEIFLSFFVMSGFFILEAIWAYWLWAQLSRSRFLQGLGKWCAILIGISFYSSYMLILTAQKAPLRFLMEASRVIPFYTEILGTLFPYRGQLVVQRVFEGSTLQPKQAYQSLQYPLKKIMAEPKAHALNLVIIAIDTWRFDMITPNIMPHLAEFAKKSVVFTQHFSGGDATGPGIFSLFYGLPATYWTAMDVQHQPPVLFTELMRQGYKPIVLVSGGLTSPPLNRTVFQSIPHLLISIPGKDPNERDEKITKMFAEAMNQRKNNPTPFFSFLFYDAPHGYCLIQNNLQPFKPVTPVCDRWELDNHSDPIPYLNRYKNAVHLTDERVGRVLDILKTHHLLENTIVIVTGDHGEEFNDNHLGYWGHSSNFTRYQVQTPLLIYWPGDSHRVINYRTTHYDIVPTLMQKLLGVTTPAEAYSIGQSLFNQHHEPYQIAVSYVDVGILETNKVTTIFPTGQFLVTERNGEPNPALRLNAPTIHAVFQDMRRFYRN